MNTKPAYFFLKSSKVVSLLILSLASITSIGENGTYMSQKINDDEASHVLAAVNQARPGLELEESVWMSPMPSLYQLRMKEGGPAIYVSKDGKYLLTGKLLAIEEDKLVDLYGLEKKLQREKVLKEFDKNKQIVFSPDDEVKAVIHVFTDVDCAYCQKFHNEMNIVNELGIEVRYLAFPRNGLDSLSADKIKMAWCAEDRMDALTRLKNQEDLDLEVCDTKVVDEEYQLGLDFGLQGTPYIVFNDGTLVPGYVPPQELAQRLGISASK